jgi:hypothetical protein
MKSLSYERSSDLVLEGLLIALVIFFGFFSWNNPFAGKMVAGILKMGVFSLLFFFTVMDISTPTKLMGWCLEHWRFSLLVMILLVVFHDINPGTIINPSSVW